MEQTFNHVEKKLNEQITQGIYENAFLVYRSRHPEEANDFIRNVIQLASDAGMNFLQAQGALEHISKVMGYFSFPQKVDENVRFL